MNKLASCLALFILGAVSLAFADQPSTSKSKVYKVVVTELTDKGESIVGERVVSVLCGQPTIFKTTGWSQSVVVIDPGPCNATSSPALLQSAGSAPDLIGSAANVSLNPFDKHFSPLP